MTTENSGAADYDVTIVGSGFAGASLAILLKRQRPGCRILVVEARPPGERKVAEVGEATVEVSACFLHRVLGAYDHLNEKHLPKHGLRFWFTDGPERSLTEMTEVGPQEIPSLPSFQLDRAVLDEHLSKVAGELGCEIARPATAVDFDLGWPVSRVRLREGEKSRWITSRWVVDATGRRALLARRLGHFERVEHHPVSAVWGRWEGVADLDGPEVLGTDPLEPRLPEITASRRLATNHFCGYGWWCWVIPLAGGRTSIGLVYNKELFELPGEGSQPERYRRFVTRHPGLKELLARAEPVDDPMAYGHLPYRSRRYMDRGWALVGDAGAFMDPFYSPGLDHAAMSIFSTSLLLGEDLAGEGTPEAGGRAFDEKIEAHNAAFAQSYDRWLSALYDGKYEILGDAELTTCAFLVDTSLYYLGVVTQVYRDLEQLKNPTFGLPIPHTRVAYGIMRFFNRRMLRLARLRRQAGTYGRRNAEWRVLSKAFGLGSGSIAPLLRGLRLWARLEVGGLFARLRTGPVDTTARVPAPVPAGRALP